MHKEYRNNQPGIKINPDCSGKNFFNSLQKAAGPHLKFYWLHLTVHRASKTTVTSKEAASEKSGVNKIPSTPQKEGKTSRPTTVKKKPRENDINKELPALSRAVKKVELMIPIGMINRVQLTMDETRMVNAAVSG